MQLISTKSINKLSLLPNTIFYSALIILVSVLPFSEYIISLSQFILAGSWLLSANFKDKISRLQNNRIFWILAGLYIIHLIGLIYTADIKYALKDLRIKAPLLLLPLIFAATPPLSKKQFDRVLQVFVLSITIACIITIGLKHGIWGNEKFDYRDASVFISHIRFSLMICLSVFIALMYVIDKTVISLPIIKYLLLFLVLFLIVTLIHVPFFTGAIIFVLSSVIYFFLFVFKKLKNLYKISSVILLLFLFAGGYTYFIKIKNLVYIPAADNIALLDKHTIKGNIYTHKPKSKQAENGYKVYNYICETELEPAWNKLSNINYQGFDKKNNELKITLFRYLSSKGLRKDEAGLNQLTSNEIAAIENSVSNAEFLKGYRLKNRLYQVIWEFYMNKSGSNPSGHSAVMRINYWQTAIHIFKNNWLIGVGTGDIIDEFEIAYEELNTKLKKKHQRRSHNQYLSIAVSFGVIGLLYFLFSLYYPLIFYKNQYYKLYFLFAVICLISMLTEDTLETQVGVTFFAFFNSLFLFLAPKQNS